MHEIDDLLFELNLEVAHPRVLPDNIFPVTPTRNEAAPKTDAVARA
jgi:hypothetical protein